MPLTRPDLVVPTVATEPVYDSWPERLTKLRTEHRAFLIALGAGAMVRLVVQIAFPPAFVYSDGPTYLRLVDALAPSPDRPVGYGFLLRALSWITRDVSAVAVTQHLLGLLTAVLIYALLRHWGVSARLATLATLPVLFDGMQLVMEHSVLSDVLFDLLLVLGVTVLAWRRAPSVRSAVLAGLILGSAVLIRVVGEPVIGAAVLFCVLAGSTVRQRIITTLAVCVAFGAPITAYAAWYHHDHGVWALTEMQGRALYMRTTTFVDCSQVSLPSYERTLCPEQPLGQRLDPTYYGWHDLLTTHALQPPPGVSSNSAMLDFALRAIKAQPGDYALTSARDFAMNFTPIRIDLFEYDTAYKWSFLHYLDYDPTLWTGPAYADHGGDQPKTIHPLGNLLAGYGFVVYAFGPLLLLSLLIAIRGIFSRRPTTDYFNRPLVVLATTVAIGLILLPDFTAEFTWRYQMPALVLAPVAAALSWTRLRSGSAQSGTTNDLTTITSSP